MLIFAFVRVYTIDNPFYHAALLVIPTNQTLGISQTELPCRLLNIIPNKYL